MKIERVIIFLEEDLPEYMSGLLRIESIDFLDGNEKKILEFDSRYLRIRELGNELIDNYEYR